MRVVAAVAALMLLAGCDSAGGKPADGPAKDGSTRVLDDFAGGSSGYDYRYAFRLPGDKLKAVLQSNADACDRIGPARCRILTMRYRVDDGNQTKAVLIFRIDPAIARDYGEAVVKSVTGVHGVLVDSEITGTDSTTSARSLALVNRLHDQLVNAQSQAATDADAKNRAERIQSALDTIAEVEAGQGQTLATAPVLITYESSNALTGFGSADANFSNAGDTLANSVGRLVNVLAAVGPWLIVLILLVALLRWIVHGTGGEPEEAPHAAEPYDNSRHEHRNLIQRWFSRDDEPEPQPHDAHS
ncbi:MAG: hypothetical protein WDN44_01400 [Sphingomonas sp.]